MKPSLHSTHHILDHTKIKDFMSCPRRFFYQYVVGWKPVIESHDLIYGQAFHIAMEYLYDKQHSRGGLTLEKRDAEEAWLMFMQEYRKHYSEEADMDKAPKDPGNTETVLREYVDLWGSIDRFKVVYSEVSGAVPINRNGRLVYFRLDTVVFEPMSGTYSVLEHKTTGWSPHLWEASMALSLQGGVGIHVLSCMYPKAQVKGLIFNGIFLNKKGNSFRRLPYLRSEEGMQDWLATINYYADRMERELELCMVHDKEDAPCMNSFPKNPNSCVAYNRPCPYLDFCRAWPNPLKTLTEEVPDGFRKTYWDPRDQDKEWHAESSRLIKPKTHDVSPQMEIPFTNEGKGE